MVHNCTVPQDGSSLQALIDGQRNITEVIITGAGLHRLPAAVCRLTNISLLNLSHNTLATFPRCIRNLANLQHLDLSNNVISQVHADDVTALSQLQTLHLQYNRIAHTDVALWEAVNAVEMQSLTLNHNQITSLPRNVTTLRFDDMQSLDLSFNYFKCNCTEKWLKTWMESLGDKLVHKFDIMCHNSQTGGAFPLLKIVDMNKFTCNEESGDVKYTRRLSTIILAFILTILILPLVVGLLCNVIYAKRRWIYTKTTWHPFDVDNCRNEQKQYDVYVSCAGEDESWCNEKIVDFLQQLNYKVWTSPIIIAKAILVKYSEINTHCTS